VNKKEVLTFVAALLAASVGAAEPDFTTLIGHRGESEDAPENTLPAYRLAVDRGFGFECDVYLSRDGRVYTFHDPNLTRTSGGANTNKCSDVTWDEVSALDVGSWGRWKGSQFAGTRPALLEEVLRLARPGRWIYIDMKTLTGDPVPYIRDILAGQTTANPGNVLFLAGTVACGKELRKHLPEYKVLYCANSRHGWKEDSPPVAVDEVLATMREMDAAGLDIRFDRDVITADFVKTVKDAGYEFHFWIYGRDRAEDVAEAFRNGADTVTTNCPKRMMDECRGAALSGE
jgi:glycerophosphoryl diester phosphodiesterase